VRIKLYALQSGDTSLTLQIESSCNETSNAVMDTNLTLQFRIDPAHQGCGVDELDEDGLTIEELVRMVVTCIS
jgi:hypothetical protein